MIESRDVAAYTLSRAHRQVKKMKKKNELLLLTV